MIDIIGYAIEKGMVARSDGVVVTEPPFLDFILEGQGIKLLSNMNYDVANLCHSINLTQNEAKILVDSERLKIWPYKLAYFNGVLFGIDRGPLTTNLYDASQYKQISLHDDIISRAKQAKEAGELAAKTMSKLGIETTSLSSPVSSFEKQVLNMMDLPTVDDIPQQAAEFAYNCCDGGWHETFKLGHFEEVYLYDIRAAYPAAMANLLDYRLGHWNCSSHWNSKAIYGYCLGQVTINSPISPVCISPEEPATRTGTWKRVMRKNQIEKIREYGIGSFDLEEAWWFEIEPMPIGYARPLKNMMEHLYEIREESNEDEKKIIKRVMSGIYGKFLQSINGSFTKNFNPVWGAEVEGQVRDWVTDIIFSRFFDPHNAININLDSFITTDKRYYDTEHIGNWKHSGPHKCISANSGAVFLDNSNNYQWLMDEVGENPNDKQYIQYSESPITLHMALQNGNWNELGNLKQLVRRVEVGDYKRCFNPQPVYGKDLLEKTFDSLPWDTSVK